MSDRVITVTMRDVHVAYTAVSDASGSAKNLLGRRKARFQRVHAVRGVSLDLYEGQTVGIIGTNGSGKSTLLAAMTGLLPVESGDVFVRSRPTLLGVGAAMRPALSGRRNIIIGGLALGLSLAEARAIVPEIIEFTGLADAIDRPMQSYSSGMRARLTFAVATATSPDILLLDEALAVGDAEFSERSQRRIGEIRDRAGTVVLVSHNQNELRSSCDRVIWMRNGEIVSDGDPDQVIDDYAEHIGARLAGERLLTPSTESVTLPMPQVRQDRLLTFLVGSPFTSLPASRYLVGYEEELKAAGISSPTFLNRLQHSQFVAAASPRAGERLRGLVGEDWSAWRDRFVSDTAERMAGDTDWVVTSEHFTSLLPTADIASVRRLAEELGFSRVRILLYAQRQDRLASRMQIASVSNGRLGEFDVDAESKRRNRYDWRRIYKLWSSGGDFDEVSLRLLPVGEGADPAADFARAIGGPEPEAGSFGGGALLSAAAVSYLRMLVNTGEEAVPRERVVSAAKALSSTSVAPFTLVRAESSALMNAFAASNEWVLEQVEGSDDVANYFAEDLSLPVSQPAISIEDMIGLSRRLIRVS